MVNGSAVSGKTSPSSASSGKSSSVKTGASAVSSDDYFSQAMLDRQKARDAATETITKVLEDKSSDDAVKKEAANKAAAITQNIIKENNIETLIKAKGFSNCIVTLDNNQCSVVVKTRTSAQDDAVVIQDIVTGQTGLSFDKIKIIERS
jgi:stage III sporulation protein AH